MYENRTVDPLDVPLEPRNRARAEEFVATIPILDGQEPEAREVGIDHSARMLTALEITLLSSEVGETYNYTLPCNFNGVDESWVILAAGERTELGVSSGLYWIDQATLDKLLDGQT